jgi:hypothetical protein
LIGTAALLALVAAACSSPDDGSRTASDRGRPAASAESAQQDAERLGRRVFQLLDHAAAYRSSHRGRLPATVAQLGLDSLTPDMVQRIRARDGSPVAQVAFRRPAMRAVAWCEADVVALEEASLNAGAFHVWCERPGGQADSFTVGGAE